MKPFRFLILLCCALFLGIPLSVNAQAPLPDVVTVSASTSQPQDGRAQLRVVLKIDPKYHINANPATEDYLIPTTVTVEKSPGIKAGAPQYPKGENKKFAFSFTPLAVYEKTAIIIVPLEVGADAKNISGRLRYQACDDRACLAPKTIAFRVSLDGQASTQIATQTPVSSDASLRFAEELRQKYNAVGLPAIVFLDGQGNERKDLRAGEELTKATFLAKLDALKTGKPFDASTQHGASSWLERLQQSALWLQLLLVFFGGLLLNLTPCVYPMIPITVGYFGGQSEGRVSKTFGLALVYVLGLALVYSSLGVFAALTGSLFGSWLQSRWVTGVVALVLLLLALSMFGFYTIQPPQFLMQKSGAKKGAFGALAMGALLGIVAAPCVGPAVAALLIYVGQQGKPILGFSLFFALSLGLGLPYLLLGTFSGAIKSMPRSGAWMEKLKKIFAVPLLIAALYYGYSALKPTPQNSGKHWPAATQVVLDTARQSGKPVVLDFRADWCIPCLKLEREVFSQPDVKQAGEGIELLQVDLTRAES
jgi:thiol:disulfide interchange protein DsbD